VFIEMPLDVQAVTVEEQDFAGFTVEQPLDVIAEADLKAVARLYNQASKPIVLIGGGVSYATMKTIRNRFLHLGIPVMTTYNGADRFDGDDPNYLGRPNTWGQRSANIIIQKADLIIAIGTRLGLQQTGFNWQEFGREARIVHVDLDEGELNKGHPRTINFASTRMISSPGLWSAISPERGNGYPEHAGFARPSHGWRPSTTRAKAISHPMILLCASKSSRTATT
jgi:acetolactate synthase-1/2/3 large subunit